MIQGCILMFLAFVVGFSAQRSRVITVGILVVLWTLMGLNTHNADYVQYQYFYDIQSLDASGITIGYLALEQVCWYFSLTFLQFRMLFAAIALVLLTLFVRRYSTRPNVVLVLYMLLPFLYDIVQFKFFLASAVAIYFLRFLIDQNRFYGFWFVAGLFLSACIHPAALLYVVFALGLLRRETAFKISITAAIIIFLAVYIGLAQRFAILFVDSTKYEAYFTNLGRFGWTPYFISVLVSVAIMELSAPFKRISNEYLPEKGEPEKFHEFFKCANYSFLPLAALLPISVQNFYRPIRSGSILYFISFASIAGDKWRVLSEKERIGLTLIAIAWFLCTQFILYNDVVSIVIVDELTNNILWL